MHGGRCKTLALLHQSIVFCPLFCSRYRFTTVGKVNGIAASRGAIELRKLLIVASIAKALSKPGIHSLDKDGDSITLSEDIVLCVLRRGLLDASKKLDFFRWCSNRPNYKHSVCTYLQMFKIICSLPILHCDDIYDLITSMKRDGLVLDSLTLKLILDGLIRSGKFDSALEILDYVERDLISTSKLSPNVYSPVVIALVRKDQISLALSIFLKLLDSSSSSTVRNSAAIPDAVACNELLVGLKKAGMKEEFKQVFDKLRETKLYPHDRWGYNICIHTLGCWGDLSTALSLFKEMKEMSGLLYPDLCTYNSLIHVLCVLGKVKDALIVWEELKVSSGHEPDAFTYRILVQGCCKSYRINDAMKIFSEMQYNGVRAETVVYNSLLNGLLKSRRLMEACNLFEKMVDDDTVKASCWTYNILIDGLYKNGRPEAALAMFSDLKKKGNSFVDAITYSIVIYRLSLEDRVEESLELLEEMEARGFVVDLVTVTSVLIALYRQGQWDATDRLMKHVRFGNLVPNILKWKSAMEILLRNPQSRKRDFMPMFPSTGDVAEILNISDSHGVEGRGDVYTEDAEKFDDEGDKWSSSPYMDWMANHYTSETSHSWPSFTMSRGIRVTENGEESFDINMVNTYLSIFLSKGKLSLACKLFEIFTNMRADPVSYTYNSIMNSFVKKGYFKEAWGVLRAMGETLNLADIATYNVIIQGLGKMGRADLANSVLEKLVREGGHLDIVMYNTLINALGKAGRIDDANKLFEQMKDCGINPDVVTYNTLIEVHSKAGRLKDAYKILKMMLDGGCVPNHVTDTTLDFLEKEIEKARYAKASIIRSDPPPC
ncbi:pentatricopeptide repeat-containing protein At4g01570 [Andrographis paniculata]|uniref:pentatricopeptide repeat-containing protein At4g01570 n=1 Tax=Andrographis paniculata TaxID=175694 RepID=UPI0021E6E9CD|nr:pentatricopeptide repeat-containing protein At4g01570 [Andrographis paniculata]XP_051152925.1 pentatricopeptide repeat-containing protein At4g01570 [Andrographis paniculata]XP_051152926.1 pentatricopeptide repeat-containing protein At4g01570 [Andrographis paniculata]XP_051152927.1 pentatricopeptide repeat-containing protein At4g01570 [Andrographis paniculata]